MPVEPVRLWSGPVDGKVTVGKGTDSHDNEGPRASRRLSENRGDEQGDDQ